MIPLYIFVRNFYFSFTYYSSGVVSTAINKGGFDMLYARKKIGLFSVEDRPKYVLFPNKEDCFKSGPWCEKTAKAYAEILSRENVWDKKYDPKYAYVFIVPQRGGVEDYKHILHKERIIQVNANDYTLLKIASEYLKEEIEVVDTRS